MEPHTVTPRNLPTSSETKPKTKVVVPPLAMDKKLEVFGKTDLEGEMEMLKVELLQLRVYAEEQLTETASYAKRAASAETEAAELKLQLQTALSATGSDEKLKATREELEYYRLKAEQEEVCGAFDRSIFVFCC